MSKKAVSCPAETALTILEGRGTLLILRTLLEGTKRFSELHRSLAGVSHRTLTHQLRQLADSVLVHRKVYAQVPAKSGVLAHEPRPNAQTGDRRDARVVRKPWALCEGQTRMNIKVSAAETGLD